MCNNSNMCVLWKQWQKQKIKGGVKMARIWTKEKAEKYVNEITKTKKDGQYGLKFWSAIDYLKKHKTMHSII